jgi:hypothetical protein
MYDSNSTRVLSRIGISSYAYHLKIGNRIYFWNMASFTLKPARQCMDTLTLWYVHVIFIPPWYPNNLIIFHSECFYGDLYHHLLRWSRKVPIIFTQFKLNWDFLNIFSCKKLLVSHLVPPQVTDRGTLTRYVGYWWNKIPVV